MNHMKKSNTYAFVKVILSITLLLWLAGSIEWAQLFVALRYVKGDWLVIALFWIIGSMLISVFKWKMILNTLTINRPFKDLWHAYWVGLFFNNFLPSSIGGDAVRILWVRNATGDTSGATVSVVIERILATMGLAVTGLIASLFVSNADIRAIGLFVVLIFVSIGLVVIMLMGWFPFQLDKKSNRLSAFLIGMKNNGSRIREQWKILLFVLVLSMVFQVSVAGVNYSIFQALDIQTIGWIDALYVIPVTSVAAMLPIGINGYGVREGAYVVLLSNYDVAAGIAFVSSLLFAFMVSLTSLYGAYIWLSHQSIGVIRHVRK